MNCCHVWSFHFVSILLPTPLGALVVHSEAAAYAVQQGLGYAPLTSHELYLMDELLKGAASLKQRHHGGVCIPSVRVSYSEQFLDAAPFVAMHSLVAHCVVYQISVLTTLQWN